MDGVNKFNFKKSLGQNFLIDNNIINKICSNISPTEKDLIIEVGPGDGALTKELIKTNAKILCFEIDKRLESKLNKIFCEKLTIVYEDFLKVDIKKYLNNYEYEKLYFVSNLPYYITTSIINKVIEDVHADVILVMMQKEVADRFKAKPNTKEYNSLSIFIQYNYEIEKVTLVSKNSFMPKPNVDSVVLKLIKRAKNINVNEQKFYKFVRDSFKYKRKTLKNNLKDYDLKKVEQSLLKNNKTLQNRAESITIEEFIDISNNI